MRFRLVQDEDGWPPAESEGLWAQPIGEDRYRIANVPWFAYEVAEDDVFAAEPDEDGVLWATTRLHPSDNCTIRVIPWNDGRLAGSQQAVLDVFVPLGVSGEGFGERLNLVALTVPNRADLAEIKAALRRGEAEGAWNYEESCLTDAWSSA